jgi:peptidoglycan/xylan/chitin deacetylase (PgdA/CDA1 family)
VRLAKPGDIILLHDGSTSKLDERGATTAELEAVITGLKRRGFATVTVPEMLHIRGEQPVDHPTGIKS